MVTDFVNGAFGGDAPQQSIALYQMAARALLVYFLGVGIVRLGKSRMIGRVTAMDMVLAVILGSVLGRAITGGAALSSTFVACIMMVGAHWVLSRIAIYSHSFGNLVKGHSRLLVEDGKMLLPAMRQSHVSEHDLLEAMHLEGLESLDEVMKAFKERSGEISIIRR